MPVMTSPVGALSRVVCLKKDNQPEARASVFRSVTNRTRRAREGKGREGKQRTREISPALSAAPAMSGAPRSDWSVIWWGFGLEGMVRGLAALGSTCVPSTAMSVREPPWGLGSDMLVVGGEVCGLGDMCVVGEGM